MKREELDEAIGNPELYFATEKVDRVGIDIIINKALFLAAKKVCFLCKNYGPSEPFGPTGARVHRYGKETSAAESCKAQQLYIED